MVKAGGVTSRQVGVWCYTSCYKRYNKLFHTKQRYDGQYLDSILEYRYHRLVYNYHYRFN